MNIEINDNKTDERAAKQPRRLKTPEERFWERVSKTETCWLWTGSIVGNTGYGVMRVNRQRTYVHRYSFYLANGYWPEPCCLHSCDVKACVNPSHLRAGTIQENAQDAIKRGQALIGSRSPFAKLKEADIPVIRRMIAEGSTVKAAAQRFGVSVSTLVAMRRGITWKHVTNETI